MSEVEKSTDAHLESIHEFAAGVSEIVDEYNDSCRVSEAQFQTTMIESQASLKSRLGTLAARVRDVEVAADRWHADVRTMLSQSDGATKVFTDSLAAELASVEDAVVSHSGATSAALHTHKTALTSFAAAEAAASKRWVCAIVMLCRRLLSPTPHCSVISRFQTCRPPPVSALML